MVKKIALGLLIVFIGMQFIKGERTTKEVAPEMDFIEMTNTPAPVAEVLVGSCYDCHSNQTTYPWYSNVAPVSWWIDDHIEEGRDELNFSEWGTFTPKRKTKKLHEIIEEVEEGEMPLSNYTCMHSDSELSDQKKTDLIQWVKYLQLNP
jgi:hypothetical protein